MSSANRVRVSIVQESTFGVTPSTPAFLTLPITSIDFQDVIPQQTDPTISPSRGIDDLIPTGRSNQGTAAAVLRFAASTAAFFAIMRAVLYASAETAAVTVTSTVTVGEADDFVERGSGSWVSDGFLAGDIVLVTGNLQSADDGYYRVTDVDALVLTLEGADWSSDDTSITVVRAARMVNGTTQRSFSVEIAHADLDEATIYTGVQWNDLAVAIADGAITTTSLSAIGKSSTKVAAPISGTGTSALYVTGATYTDPASHPAITTLGVPEIKVGGADYAFKSLDLRMANNLEALTQVGQEGPTSIREGQFAAELGFRSYMDGVADFSTWVANTETTAWFVLLDANSRGWSFSFPRAKYRGLTAPVPGVNQTVYKQGALQMLQDATYGTVIVQRWA